MEQSPELPADLKLEDLRFPHPDYPLIMAMQGWQAVLQRDVDANPAKIYLSLSRPVTTECTAEVLARLASRMHIVDPQTDGFRPGYSLASGSDENSAQSGETLRFSFEGFPTKTTMLALYELERAFSPPDKAARNDAGRLRRLARRVLGRSTA